MDLSVEAIQQHIDQKTKPPGSLGQLEEIAARLCRVLETLEPKILKPVMFVIAGDHGIAAEGVSAYPQAVTGQMVANIVQGGAAINALSRAAGMEVVVVDAGVATSLEGITGQAPLLHRKIAKGTANVAEAPAMKAAEVETCLALGSELVRDARSDGSNTIGLGEMGIANTSSASLLLSALLGVPIEELVGRGTGLDDEGLARKRNVLSRAMERHGVPDDPMEIAATYGGLEIVTMSGAMAEAARNRMIVLVDGFIATAAFALAERIEPMTREVAIFGHASAEAGHTKALERLGVRPLLDLGLRLGEGTGAALALPIVRAAASFVSEMASFADAGVDGAESEPPNKA